MVNPALTTSIRREYQGKSLEFTNQSHASPVLYGLSHYQRICCSTSTLMNRAIPEAALHRTPKEKDYQFSGHIELNAASDTAACRA